MDRTEHPHDRCVAVDDADIRYLVPPRERTGRPSVPGNNRSIKSSLRVRLQFGSSRAPSNSMHRASRFPVHIRGRMQVDSRRLHDEDFTVTRDLEGPGFDVRGKAQGILGVASLGRMHYALSDYGTP